MFLIPPRSGMFPIRDPNFRISEKAWEDHQVEMVGQMYSPKTISFHQWAKPFIFHFRRIGQLEGFRNRYGRVSLSCWIDKIFRCPQVDSMRRVLVRENPIRALGGSPTVAVWTHLDAPSTKKLARRKSRACPKGSARVGVATRG